MQHPSAGVGMVCANHQLEILETHRAVGGILSRFFSLVHAVPMLLEGLEGIAGRWPTA
ncbi:MAG: hypothetical protein U0401_21085 [Anaerolineae bacterium]